MTMLTKQERAILEELNVHDGYHTYSTKHLKCMVPARTGQCFRKGELTATLYGLRHRGLIEMTRNNDWVIMRDGLKALKEAK